MKCLICKKTVSFLLVMVVVIAMVSSCLFVSNAVTYVTYGDYLLALNSNNTYLVGGYNGNDTELTFPKTANGKAVVGVAESFADKCNSEVTSIVMPNTYTTIESYAFYNCSSLRSINIPADITSIGSMAFNKCSALESVDLSVAKNLKSIPYACFSGCTLLSSVALSDSLTSISNYAFSNCTSLGSVQIPNGVSKIGSGAFYSCTALRDIEIPVTVESIGQRAFYDNTNLTKVFVPNSVTSIGSDAFSPMALQGGTLSIDCYNGSYAADYAYSNYLNYTGEELIMGDVDGDGTVNVNDATYIQLFRVGRYSIATSKVTERADVTGDGKVSLRDATVIQMYKAGMIENL